MKVVIKDGSETALRVALDGESEGGALAAEGACFAVYGYVQLEARGRIRGS